MKKKQTSLQIYYFGGNSKKEYVTQNLYDKQFKNMFYPKIYNMDLCTKYLVFIIILDI